MKSIIIVIFALVCGNTILYSNANQRNFSLNSVQQYKPKPQRDGYTFVSKVYVYTLERNKTGYEEAQLYVKVINGKSFYRIYLWGDSGVNFDVGVNPHYNPNSTTRESKYTHKLIGVKESNMYLNI